MAEVPAEKDRLRHLAAARVVGVRHQIEESAVLLEVVRGGESLAQRLAGRHVDPRIRRPGVRQAASDPADERVHVDPGDLGDAGDERVGGELGDGVGQLVPGRAAQPIEDVAQQDARDRRLTEARSDPQEVEGMCAFEPREAGPEDPGDRPCGAGRELVMQRLGAAFEVVAGGGEAGPPVGVGHFLDVVADQRAEDVERERVVADVGGEAPGRRGLRLVVWRASCGEQRVGGVGGEDPEIEAVRQRVEGHPARGDQQGTEGARGQERLDDRLIDAGGEVVEDPQVSAAGGVGGEGPLDRCGAGLGLSRDRGDAEARGEPCEHAVAAGQPFGGRQRGIGPGGVRLDPKHAARPRAAVAASVLDSE